MNQKSSITLKLSFAWWLKPYIHALGFFCAVMQTEPDWDKVAAVTKRAARIKVQ